MNSSGSTIIGENTESEPQIKLQTAFVVFIDELGRVGYSPEPELLADNVIINRPAGVDEIYGAVHNIADLISAQRGAMQTHTVMVTQAQAAARAQADARLTAKVNASRVN